jgi:hypothetical protein
MGPTKQLIDEIYREKVLRGEGADREQTARGAEIFEEVCERMAASLRSENPDADEGDPGPPETTARSTPTIEGGRCPLTKRRSR